MAIIDADAHVLETPDTWSFMAENERAFMPMIVSQTHGDEVLSNAGAIQHDYWVIENRINGKDRNVGLDTTKESREMVSVDARLSHMDELGIDVQVLYPTLFLRPVARDHRLEFALVRSYNRWLAEIWKQSPDRLRWVALAPLLSADKLRDEMEFAKDNGACGIFLRGLEDERNIADPYFHPLYALAEELDLPICMHSGNGSFLHHDFFLLDTTFTKFKLAVVGAFHSLLEKEIPAQFPKLRWGFVEVSAQWVPYVLNDLEDRFRRRGKTFWDNPLADNNMYVACEVTDDLGYVVGCAGEDQLMLGTDYGHHDPSAEIEAFKLIREQGLDDRVVEKIIDHNPRAFYGLT